MWLPVISLLLICCSFTAAEKNFYEILGIKSTTTQKGIEKAYQKGQNEFRKLLSQGQIPDSTKLQKLVEAYSILSNPQKRAIYDEELENTVFEKQAARKMRTTVDEESDRSNYLSRKQLDTLMDKDFDEENDFAKKSSTGLNVQSGAFSQSSFSQTDGEEPIISSRSGGFHSDGECTTVTERNGNSVSTKTTCK